MIQVVRMNGKSGTSPLAVMACIRVCVSGSGPVLAALPAGDLAAAGLGAALSQANWRT